jgi:hypothetical protein
VVRSTKFPTYLDQLENVWKAVGHFGFASNPKAGLQCRGYTFQGHVVKSTSKVDHERSEWCGAPSFQHILTSWRNCLESSWTPAYSNLQSTFHEINILMKLEEAKLYYMGFAKRPVRCIDPNNPRFRTNSYQRKRSYLSRTGWKSK